MDTDGVRLFVLAANLLNISAAGRQLGLAPAVASARLAKLERKLGADLLHRSTRKVSLSLEGAEFLPFAREILAQADAANAALGNTRMDVSGTLRFAASSTFVQLHIAPILPEFLDRHPGLHLDLKLSDTQMDLIEGGYDLALRNYAIEDSSLRARKLADDRRILCASPNYLARHGTPSTAADLADHQLIGFSNGPPRTLSTAGTGASGTFPPAGTRPRIICDDGASMRLAAQAGAGIAMSSLWSLYRDLQDGLLVRVLPDHEIDDGSAIWLVYPKSNVLTAKVRVFIDFLTEKIGRAPSWQDPSTPGHDI
ncbi:LysR family transcriptional regulator [Maricaulis sp. W15]|uniref:LysR family transcriptional regulator n=1 Tax=Maricaulis sp. W15 TaxID=1772333 RepID=UPI000948E2A1|nr:LysR family transcriptional regulator [Maricaulis sp. W15]OLF72179.1 LysR family transcriptional regulator [Maricaulis sp. W15]